jgi:hypothetical protein
MHAAELLQLAQTVLMVRPIDFGYNVETASDNEFQQLPSDDTSACAAALEEFQQSVHRLCAHGIDVLVLEPSSASVRTPDAVFPNNWISTEPDGTVYLYPMRTINRRAERERYPDVEALFRRAGFAIRNVVSIGAVGATEKFLEGTGSMCIDRRRRIVYAGLSNRTDPYQLWNFVHTAGYERAVTFHTRTRRGAEFYHTNVVLNLGDGFAIVCLDAVPDPTERSHLVSELQKGREIIEISLDQTEEHFCGNAIHLATKCGPSAIALSRRALAGFTPAQRAHLERFGRLLELRIDHIEHTGGGSARCMIAEVFLPKR